MGIAPRSRLIRLSAGVVCYLAGMVLLARTVVVVFTSPSVRLTAFTTGGFAASLCLLVAGSVLLRRADAATGGPFGAFRGGNPGPPRSRLERFGYRLPPDDADRPDHVYEDGHVYVLCAACGERNDPSYDYCRSCSTRLPELSD